MIVIKHLFDSVDPADGERLWIEPIGLTKDLQEWCGIVHMLTHLGPPMRAWRWFADHRIDYEEFRGRYHEHLRGGKYLPALQALAAIGLHENFTLVHQGDDASHNTAVALHEFLLELQTVMPE